MDKKRYKRIRQDVIMRDGLRCAYCEAQLTPELVTLDHIVPISRRGTFNSTNLTVSCSRCNNKRGSTPFFDFIVNFNFEQPKINKYIKLYDDNLKIKILNIAKEECLIEEQAVPTVIITKACSILKINVIDFSVYQDSFEFEFQALHERKKIKFYFEKLIKIIEYSNL